MARQLDLNKFQQPTPTLDLSKFQLDTSKFEPEPVQSGYGDTIYDIGAGVLKGVGRFGMDLGRSFMAVTNPNMMMHPMMSQQPEALQYKNYAQGIPGYATEFLASPAGTVKLGSKILGKGRSALENIAGRAAGLSDEVTGMINPATGRPMKPATNAPGPLRQPGDKWADPYEGMSNQEFIDRMKRPNEEFARAEDVLTPIARTGDEIVKPSKPRISAAEFAEYQKTGTLPVEKVRELTAFDEAPKPKYFLDPKTNTFKLEEPKVPSVIAKPPIAVKPPIKPPVEPPSILDELPDDLPEVTEEVLKKKDPGSIQRIYDLSRGMMSVDPPFISSAAFRQAGKFAGTKPWFQAWGEAAKAFGSKVSSEKMSEAILNRPLFKPKTISLPNGQVKEVPSYAEQVGLRLGGKGWRDEAIKGELAEQIPLWGKYVASSNRAYTAFLNHVSASKFEQLIQGAEKLGKDPLNNLPVGEEIAEFVNSALHRGKLAIETPRAKALGLDAHQYSLEKNARLLSNMFFSPRTISSTVRFLNPSTYVNASPEIRKQYMTAMLRQVALWWTVAEVAEWGGAQVSKEPTSSDFGKIRIGDTRIDIPGGLQQFLVFGARMAPGIGGGTTSTETEQFRPFGEGYKPETRFSTATKFAVNRAHPTLKAVIDFLSASKDVPFRVGDKLMQLAAPMYADDLVEVLRSNPELAPFILGLSGSGVGTQSYERGSFGKPVYIPENIDLTFSGR